MNKDLFPVFMLGFMSGIGTMLGFIGMVLIFIALRCGGLR